MVSALRERAARQFAAEPAAEPAEAPARAAVEDDDVEFTTPLRPNRSRLRRKPRGLRRLDFRRVGLGVSIAGAMLASAIGGGLLVAWPKWMSAGAAAEVHLPPAAAFAASAASAVHAGHAGHAASGSASGTVAHAALVSEHAAEPVAEHAAEHAAEPASAAHPAEVPASAAASAPASPPAAAVPVPAVAPVADLTFGLDLNGDGIPDSLERFVRKTINAPATRVAARHYYGLALPLATRAQQGEVLPHAEQQALFRATECYWLSAAEDGIGEPPNLNDRASLIGRAAAVRMQALAAALQGFDYRVGAGKRQVCG